jgi:hypothetical protein
VLFENLARYIIRASFSQDRMTYIPGSESPDGRATVIYRSKDGTTEKDFEALDWLAQLSAHIPARGEQMARYYGYYSNKSRGVRKKEGKDDEVAALIENDLSPKTFKKNWARLIQKVYDADPLVCPKCEGRMRIISFIEQPEVIDKILRHLDLWDPKIHGPPSSKTDHIPELIFDDSFSQLPERDYWME